MRPVLLHEVLSQLVVGNRPLPVENDVPMGAAFLGAVFAHDEITDGEPVRPKVFKIFLHI